MSTHRAFQDDLRVELLLALDQGLADADLKQSGRKVVVGEQTRQQIIARVMHAIDNEFSCVVRTDVGFYGARTRFGEQVPWPAELPMQHRANDRMQMNLILGDEVKAVDPFDRYKRRTG